MKEINISCYSNKRVRTLIRFFNHIFINSIQPDINMAEEFVDRYIPDTKKFILGSTKGNLKNLNNILFVSDNEKRIKEEFEEKRKNFFKNSIARYISSGKISVSVLKQMFGEIIESEEIISDSFQRYKLDSVASNICTILITIDISLKEDENIFINIELGEYEEVYKKINSKIADLIFISNGVADYVMDIYRGKEFNFSKHYAIMPDMHKYLIYQRNIQSTKDIKKLIGKNNCFISDIVLGFELLIVKRKTDILELILALICIYKSYEYEEYMQDYAKQLIDLIQEIMFCGEIHKIYIQMKEYNIEIPMDERGSDDATTRFSIIFTASNDDIYLLRIDLPHKGEEKFHLNLHEYINGKLVATGYPLDDDIKNNERLRDLLGNKFDEIFFRNEGHIWFKADFENRLEKMNIGQETKKELLTLFKYRCHYPIVFNVNDENKYVEFLEEMKEYLVSFDLEGSIIKSYNKNTKNIEEEVIKIRIIQMYINKLMEGMEKSTNTTVNGNKYIWELFKGLGLNKRIDEEVFMTYSLSECWKYVDEYIF